MRALPLALGITLLGWLPFVAWSQAVFLNEFHYDNTGTDADEGVEIAGPAGTNLESYTVVLYNGTGGAVYNMVLLSGTIPNQGGTGFGAVWIPISGIQNDVDGMALARNSGSVVVQSLAYEGSLLRQAGRRMESF